MTFWTIVISTSNMTTVTEIRSARVDCCCMCSTFFAHSFNFLVTWGLSVTVSHSMCTFCVYCMAMYWPTLQFYPCMYVLFVCRYVAPPMIVITTLYYIMLHVCTLLHWIVQKIFNKIKVWASSSYCRLALCQILFLLWPSLLS